MAASTVAGKEKFSGLRPVNIQTDLAGIAELIELCFGPVMDEGARAAIREKQMLSRSGPLLRLIYGLDRLLGGLDQGMVWVEDGRLVGNVSIALANYPRMAGTGYIVANVAVHPDYRGRGVARALMVAALNMIRQKNGAFAVLQVDAGNATARHIYNSLGFREERTFIRWHRPSHLRAPRRLENMPFITLRQGNEWHSEYELAQLVRPNTLGGIGWLQPTHPDLFRPSLLRMLGNLVTGQGDERWITRRDNGEGIAAVLRTVTTFGGPIKMSLMVHPVYQRRHEEPLLNFALRRFEHQRRLIQMEHPADDEYTSGLLAQMGFEKRNTHVNMRYDFR